MVKGWKDFTVPITIEAVTIETLPIDVKTQTLGTVKIDVAAQTLGQLNVNITASAITLNVNVAASAVTLNIKTAVGEHVDTDIVSSITLGIDIKAQTVGNIAVNIAAQSLGQLNVNIAASAITLNVNIAAQAVDINVNIAASAVTLNVNIAAQAANVNIDFKAQSISVKLVPDWGAINATDIDLEGTVSTSSGTAATAINYTVPTGKTLLIYDFSVTMWSKDTGVLGILYNQSSDLILFRIGSLRGAHIAFAKPKRLSSDQILHVDVVQNSGASEYVSAHAGGILI